MSVIIPFASGKGGVGKSVTAVHTAVALSQHGKSVVLMDGDTGGSNVHTLLNLPGKNPGLGSLIHRQEKAIEHLILETAYPRLYVIPGDGQFTGTANPPFWLKRKLFKELPELVCDFLLIDLGAGVGTFTLDMFLLSNRSIVVTTPEIPALLNAYNFVKSAVIRIFQQHTKNKSPEGVLAQSLHSRGLESKIGVQVALERIRSLNEDAALRIEADIRRFRPQLVLNMGTHQQDLALGRNVKTTAQKHLGVDVDYLAFIPWEAEVRSLVNSRQLVFDGAQQTPLRQAYVRLARKLLEFEGSAVNRPYTPSDDELLEGLV